jgi:hypothetical protein
VLNAIINRRQLIMGKVLAAALAIAGAAWFTAPANAAPTLDGIQNSTQTDLSAARRHYRHYRRARIYTYPGPTPYGYYGPTYYERPYARPAPLFFGLGGRW